MGEIGGKRFVFVFLVENGEISGQTPKKCMFPLVDFRGEVGNSHFPSFGNKENESVGNG